ncbi:hypothetical protein FLTE109939_06615 [Flavobacterium terrigena]|uniref:Uncharacterized protein n=1 Tax=Flavobacterium terrigena TaxID=402734 RepID=A0A1H6SHD8_9FLAO|nr:hypothetical protein SAMN05660918_1204 [Flavobacterium terrigena]
MYSNFIKFVLSFTGLSPILLSYWIVKTLQNFKNLNVYITIDSWQNIVEGLKNIIINHYFLFLFILIFILCRFLFLQGLKNLSKGSIVLKSIKSVDINFNPILFSYILPWSKFFFKDNEDLIFVIGFSFVYLLYTYIGKNSYHYNLILRLLGYKNYEVQTKKEMSYLLLSKETLINVNQVTEYIQVSDYMIVNVSNKNLNDK